MSEKENIIQETENVLTSDWWFVTSDWIPASAGMTKSFAILSDHNFWKIAALVPGELVRNDRSSLKLRHDRQVIKFLCGLTQGTFGCELCG